MFELGNLLQFLFNAFFHHSGRNFFLFLQTAFDIQFNIPCENSILGSTQSWIICGLPFKWHWSWFCFPPLIFFDWEFISSAIFIWAYFLIFPFCHTNCRLYYILTFFYKSEFVQCIFLYAIIIFHSRLLIKSHVLIQGLFVSFVMVVVVRLHCFPVHFDCI